MPQSPSPPQDAAAQWDEQLLAWPRAHLLQSWGWGGLQAGAGWEVERLRVAVDGESVPLPLTALRGGAGAPGLPPRLYVPKGPACPPGNERVWAAAVAALSGLAERRGAAAVTVEPPCWYDERPLLAASLGLAWQPAPATQPAHTAVVDLRGGEEAVLARMKPKGRYNARLAARKGVEIRTATSAAEGAAELARLCAATARRQGINLPGAAYFRRALECLPSARVHLACVAGEAVSGVLVAHFAGEMLYLYGGSTTAHRERQPSSLLHLHVIREAIAAGCDRYDLWGIPPGDDPGHAWHGLRQFKLQLGGVERSTAGAFVLVRRPLAFRAVRTADSARRALRRVRSNVPLQSRARAQTPSGDT
jgi:lipid II:glycine glycyltransferase (peptidoglycan interpeptide bridge formation enzyme)